MYFANTIEKKEDLLCTITEIKKEKWGLTFRF